MTIPPTVFFLSDYGTQDEFVGVVHAVIAAGAPGVRVVDLTHQIPPFDVRAGAYALERALPHLPPGIVLAVVDPGVGTARRGVCLRVRAHGGPSLFVGPDNGLLLRAAELAGDGTIEEAVAFPPRQDDDGRGSSFDGRDVFAPAVAELCLGAEPADLGMPVEVNELVRLFGAIVELGRDDQGRSCMRCEVTWVDRFGNVQLAATAADAHAAGLPEHGTVEVAPPGGNGVVALPGALVPKGLTLRRVDAFADLAPAELGLFLDANGHLAVVAGEASAAHWLNVAAGELVVLSW
jgi:S-adenosylmethionine hydrolase